MRGAVKTAVERHGLERRVCLLEQLARGVHANLLDKRGRDFVMAARADGFEFGRRVDAMSELEDQLKAFVEFRGPAFLEVMVDKKADVFLMVGPGQSYAKMITGPFIPSRIGPETTGKGTERQAAADMF